MKKHLFKLISIVAVIAIIGSLFASCGKSVAKSEFYSEYSIRSSAKFMSADSAEVKSQLSGKDGDYIDIVFDGEQTVDTVVLNEKGDNITEYEISVKQNGEFVLIYKQDKVGSIRYCAFDNTETDAVRVKINSTREGEFELTNIDILNVKHSRDDFRIMTYATADSIYKSEAIDPAAFEIITDVALFGAVKFDEGGNIEFNDYEIDGETVNGMDALKKNIENIKAVDPKNRVKIYINILGPDGDDYKDKEDLHTEVFKNKSDTLISGIKEMLEELSADGIYFDYEYPYKGKSMKAYSDFLVKLDTDLGDNYKLGIAAGPWGKKLSKDAQKAVDYIEVMAYDMFDEDGYHAAFASNGGALSLDFFSKAGYDMAKCDLGVPFYARPVNQDALWLSYNTVYEKLGKFTNTDSSTIDVEDKKDYNITRYYNSYQMVMDKTAYSFDCGAGGMMVWHYSCDARVDTGMSLFAAMADAVESRQS